jgi:prepilin-type N-terminal cleavage/methylation domain-containing protein
MNKEKGTRFIKLSQVEHNLWGFTLIELLVVIAIIGFIASVGMYAINNARMRARDARRLADLKAIEKAIKIYYDDNNKYPGSGNNTTYNNPACTSSADGKMHNIIPPSYISVIPDDPLYNQDPGCYYYIRRNSGQGYILIMNPENDDLLDEDMDCPVAPLTYYCIGENW